jgi:hypothetical protein
VTVAVGGMGIDIALLVRLREFVEEECMVGLCFVERGGALTHEQFQMVVEGDFSSLSVLE